MATNRTKLSRVLSELTWFLTGPVSCFSIDPMAPIWLCTQPQLERKDISLTNGVWFSYFYPYLETLDT